ncbi:hypothetical protein KFE25_001954 [Diacronema lutheri]|uniref:Uncharacterized protein n=1 Tax=Diacronema lutheri TaxID=2081491 RepID=A0A8J5XK69_DIALT|nr:hypothetical protein KFE25_001954 [Diacronema lutheri]
MSASVIVIFDELYAQYVREGRVDPSSDPRPAFGRAHAAIAPAKGAAGHVVSSHEAPRPRAAARPALDCAVIGRVSLPLLDAAAHGPRVPDTPPDERMHGERATTVGDEDASLLPEPPTLGGWFVNRRQTLDDEASPNAIARPVGPEEAQSAITDAAWPQWLR